MAEIVKPGIVMVKPAAVKTADKVRELKRLVGEAKANLFLRARYASEILADKDFIRDHYNGEEQLAASGLEEEYFSDLGRLITVWALVRIYRTFPTQEQWEEWRSPGPGGSPTRSPYDLRMMDLAAKRVEKEREERLRQKEEEEHACRRAELLRSVEGRARNDPITGSSRFVTGNPVEAITRATIPDAASNIVEMIDRHPEAPSLWKAVCKEVEKKPWKASAR